MSLCVSGEMRLSLWLANIHEMEHPDGTANCDDSDLPMAFALVRETRANGLERGESYRPLGRQALSKIIQDRMA